QASQRERLAFLVKHAPPKASYDRVKRIESSIKEKEKIAKLPEAELREFLRVEMQIEVAVLLMNREKYEAAEREFQGALEVYDRLFRPSIPSVIFLRQCLYIVKINMGKANEALALAKQAIHQRKELQGEKHPDYVVAYMQLGLIQLKSKHFDDAEESLK